MINYIIDDITDNNDEEEIKKIINKKIYNIIILLESTI
jgi:hypothetical protein